MHGKALYENRLGERLKVLVQPRVLIIEIGYLPIDRQGRNLFFRLVSGRYEDGGIVLTSNQSRGTSGEEGGVLPPQGKAQGRADRDEREDGGRRGDAHRRRRFGVNEKTRSERDRSRPSPSGGERGSIPLVEVLLEDLTPEPVDPRGSHFRMATSRIPRRHQ